MTCKQCNSEIGNQRYCPNCGTDNSVVQPAPQASFEMPQQNQAYNMQNEPQAYVAPETVQPTFQQDYSVPQQQPPVYQQDYVAPQQQPPVYQQDYTAPQQQPPVYQQDFATPAQNTVVNNDNPYNQYLPNTPHAQQYAAQQNGYAQPNYAPQQNGYAQPTYGQTPDQQVYNQQQYNPQQNYGAAPVGMEDPGKSKATAALIWGIVSLLFGWIPAVVALVMAKKYGEIGNGENASKAKTGKILGFVGIGLNVLALIICIIAIIALVGAVGSVMDSMALFALPFLI